MEKKIIIAAVIIVGIIIYILAGWSKENDDLNSKAIKLTKDYLEKENIVINDQKYFYINEILYMNETNDAILFENCNMSSGIIVSKNKDNTIGYKPVLKCVNYNSINNPENYIKLKGEKIVVLNNDESFVDMGYDESPVDILKDEQIVSENIKIINYYAISGTEIIENAERIVLKADEKTLNIDGSYDASFPRINLIGDEIANLSYGAEYKDDGYIATDANDGIITDKVEVFGDIDAFTMGEYKLNYKITNSKGNSVSTNRTVKVIENTISANGTCVASVYLNEIKVDTNVPNNVKIINYRYKINNIEDANNDGIYHVQEKFTRDNLPSVKVTINDGGSSNSSLVCSVVSKLTPQMYTDVNGYNCLEGFVCYKQKDYSMQYQATTNGVGTVSSSGCLPTSMTIISTKFDKRSLSGDLYNPESLIKEVIYTQGKVWGYSNYGRVKYIAEKLNLKVTEEYSIRKNLDIFKKALSEGNPIIALVTDGCYANSGGHYLTVIGINEDETQIFISDPYSRTTSSMHKTCTVNTWSDINEFINKGAVSYFSVISE